MTHADYDHWPPVAHGQDAAIAVLEAQVHDLQDQLNRRDHVIAEARKVARWWDVTCDRIPIVSAPWVGSLNLALRRLDTGKP